MKNKKGAISVKFLIGIVILVISFAVILLFWSSFNWSGSIDKEACHQSVIYRATFNTDILEPGRENIPLKCKTEKLCLTASGDKCEAILGEASKNNPITKVSIDDKKEVMDSMADSLFDCHSMLGEGKLNFMPHDFATSSSYCLMCSRVVLDAEAKDKVNDISYIEFYKHLEEKRTPSGQSYLSYIYGVRNAGDLNPFFEEALDKLPQDEKNERGIVTISDLKIDIDSEKGNAILVNIETPGEFASLAKSALIGAAVTTGIIALPFTGGTSSVLIALAAGGSATGVLYKMENPEQNYDYYPPWIYPYDLNDLNGIGCSSFEIAP